MIKLSEQCSPWHTRSDALSARSQRDPVPQSTVPERRQGRGAESTAVLSNRKDEGLLAETP